MAPFPFISSQAPREGRVEQTTGETTSKSESRPTRTLSKKQKNWTGGDFTHPPCLSLSLPLIRGVLFLSLSWLRCGRCCLTRFSHKERPKVCSYESLDFFFLFFWITMNQLAQSKVSRQVVSSPNDAKFSYSGQQAFGGRLPSLLLGVYESLLKVLQIQEFILAKRPTRRPGVEPYIHKVTHRIKTLVATTWHSSRFLGTF